jgi:hypothetical protein
MSVVYTTNLALAQPVTGTESGTWGDDVNNGLTSYLDIAIAGGLAITVTTADVTLTNTQGTSSSTGITSSTAQYAILNISGAMTAARNLIVPSSSKSYIIYNNTTGGYTLTVKGSATTGVGLVNGEKAIVAWNGSDYIKIASSVATALTGVLPLANGGTNATSAPAAMASLMGFTSTATTNVTTTLTNTSSYYQIFTAVLPQTIVLPVTSTLATGWTFHICNNTSVSALTVNSSGGNLLISIPPGLTAMCTCVSVTGTTAASWEAGITDFSTITGTGSAVLNTTPAITNPTVTDYVETTYSANSSTAITIDLANGTVQIITLTGNCTITMPTVNPGKSFIMLLKQDAIGNRTVTWSTVAWPNATTPTITSTASKQDIYSFFCDSSRWYGTTIGQNYTY